MSAELVLLLFVLLPFGVLVLLKLVLLDHRDDADKPRADDWYDDTEKLSIRRPRDLAVLVLAGVALLMGGLLMLGWKLRFGNVFGD